ncbi:hypothetical protein [Mycobacterium parascrofulaceum]|uniref:hypothetical protein n=1 Tax=Mycobacterium parascrofulaceum TaxID=240125 RepID=UPI0012F4B5A4|nr:hypothetical protein [Mycobacterium parascrofulaceum]
MQDWAESELAWELADTVSPRLSPDHRAAIYAAIGAGNAYAAIVALLKTTHSGPAVLPLPLIDRLRDWLDGYRYSVDSANLRHLLDMAAPVEPEHDPRT